MQKNFSRQNISKSNELLLSRFFPSQYIIGSAVFIFGILLIFIYIANNGINLIVYFLLLLVLIGFILNLILIFYYERIIITDMSVIHKKFFFLIPLNSTVYKKQDLKLTLISDNEIKLSLRIHRSFDWLVFVTGDQKIPILAFLNPPTLPVRQYVKNLIDIGINCDESIEKKISF